MGIFKRKTRKDKRGIVPVTSATPVVIDVETYDLTGDEPIQTGSYTVYETPAPSYDRSPTTYDSSPPSSSSNDTASYSGGGE